MAMGVIVFTVLSRKQFYIPRVVERRLQDISRYLIREILMQTLQYVSCISPSHWRDVPVFVHSNMMTSQNVGNQSSGASCKKITLRLTGLGSSSPLLRAPLSP